MEETARIPRRKVMRAAGLTVSTGVIAGCIDESSVDDPDDSSDENGQPSNEQAPDDDTEEGTTTDADESGDDSESGSGAIEIEPGTEIELRSLPVSWEGVAPSGIEGIENPDISLVEGETYTITWAENDSGSHNLAVYDDTQSAVAGPTELTDEPGDDQSIDFEASDETVEYVCEPHYTAGMVGSIELQGDGGNESDGGEDSERDGDAFEIEPGTEIELAGHTTHWTGLAPREIEGVENPTLVLQEGETYTVGWDEGNGISHDIALWDDDESTIEATEHTDDPSYDEQSIVFEATNEIAEYVCRPHANAGMRGDIEIVSSN